MRAVHYVPGTDLKTVDVERVAPGPGAVEVEIAYTGLCGTDLHIFAGHMDTRVPRPLIPGHETSGRVSRLGSGVNGVLVGDPVSVVPLVPDRTCAVCAQGYGHVCPNMSSLGIDSHGSLQEYWVVPAGNVVSIGSDVPLARAALCEPLAVAVHTTRRAGLTNSDMCVVIGGGPIGSLIATLILHKGGDVLVLEPSPWRRAWLDTVGIRAIDPAAAGAEVAERTAGRGVEVVFEVSGSAQGAATATGLAAVRGRVVIVGVHDAPREFDLHRIFWRELTVIGTRVYEREDVETAAELLKSLDTLDQLVTATYPLEQINDAVSAMRAGVAMKVLITSPARTAH